MTFLCPMVGGSSIISNSSLFLLFTSSQNAAFSCTSYHGSHCVLYALKSPVRTVPTCQMTLCQFNYHSGGSRNCLIPWLQMLRILVIVSHLLVMSVAMTSSLVPLLVSIHSSTTRLLHLHIAIQTLFLFLNLNAEWQIPIPPFSLGGSWKDMMSALHFTLVPSTVMVPSDNLVQWFWITLMIGIHGICFCFSPCFCRGGSRNLCLGYYDISGYPRCLPRLYICSLLFFISPSCGYSSPGPKTKQHSFRPWCQVHSFARGSLFRCTRLSVLLCHFGSFALLCAPAVGQNMISFAIGPFLQWVAAVWYQLCHTPDFFTFVVASSVMARAVATLGLAAARVPNVTQSAAVFISPGRAHLHEQLDSVLHSCHHDEFHD